MKPWYGGINNHDDLKDCTPESPGTSPDLNSLIPSSNDILPTVTPAGIILVRHHAPTPPRERRSRCTPGKIHNVKI